MICIRLLTDRNKHVNTWIFIQRKLHLNCINLKRRWMSARCYCHRIAACIICIQSKHKKEKKVVFSQVGMWSWHQNLNTQMNCNQTEVSMNVMSNRKKGFSLIIIKNVDNLCTCLLTWLQKLNKKDPNKWGKAPLLQWMHSMWSVWEDVHFKEALFC